MPNAKVIFEVKFQTLWPPDYIPETELDSMFVLTLKHKDWLTVVENFNDETYSPVTLLLIEFAQLLQVSLHNIGKSNLNVNCRGRLHYFACLYRVGCNISAPGQ